jgi:hypothetical protein
LIGNKVDMIQKPSRAAELFIKKLQEEKKYKFYIASAKTGVNIN